MVLVIPIYAVTTDPCNVTSFRLVFTRIPLWALTLMADYDILAISIARVVAGIVYNMTTTNCIKTLQVKIIERWGQAYHKPKYLSRHDKSAKSYFASGE